MKTKGLSKKGLEESVVWGFVKDSVWSSVRWSVENSVENSVKWFVENSVKNSFSVDASVIYIYKII